MFWVVPLPVTQPTVSDSGVVWEAGACGLRRIVQGTSADVIAGTQLILHPLGAVTRA